VTHAIESIASISEELSVQVEEVAASAGSLSGLAQGLQQVVARFKLNDTGEAAPTAQAALAAATSSRVLAGPARPTHRADQRTANLSRYN
jgi:hypothetical protein